MYLNAEYSFGSSISYLISKLDLRKTIYINVVDLIVMVHYLLVSMVKDFLSITLNFP